MQAWNKERSAAIEVALNSVLYKEFIKEIRTKLEQEAKDGIIKVWGYLLYGECTPRLKYRSKKSKKFVKINIYKILLGDNT